MGFANVVMTAFFVGHWPEYYWIYLLVKTTFYLFVSWHLKLKEKEGWFHMEFCWVYAHL
jgi:hypothetical protein